MRRKGKGRGEERGGKGRGGKGRVRDKEGRGGVGGVREAACNNQS